MRDYDCCGIGTAPGIFYQTRKRELGPRCYTFRKQKEPCTDKSQCKSQRCVDGTCQGQPRPRNTPMSKPDLCPITYPDDHMTAVLGELTSEEVTCPC